MSLRELRGAARRLCGPFFLISLVLGSSGCATYAPQFFNEIRGQTSQLNAPRFQEIVGLPFIPDDDLFCGPAALSMVLTHAGRHAPFELVAPRLFLPGRKGTIQLDMLGVARTYGLTPHVIGPSLSDLIREVAAGRPVIVLENFGFSWLPIWHYATVVGFDLDKHTVIRKSSVRERSVTPMAVFENIWKAEGYWGFVLLQPGEMPTRVERDRWFLDLSESERFMTYPDAERSWRSYAARFPSHGLGHAALGNVLFNQASYEEAAEHYRTALLSDSTNPRIAELATTIFDRVNTQFEVGCARRVAKGAATWPCE